MKAKFLKCVIVLAVFSLGSNLVMAQADPNAPEQTWTVNFKDTDIVEVVKFIGEVTGKTIIVDPKVRGPIKVISNRQLNKKELYELFLAVLDVHGFTAIDSDGVVRVVANRDARNLPIPTEDVLSSKDDGYITQIIQLNNISAAKVLAALRPLVPQYGHLSAYEPSNALIISDTRANIARINQLISQMDRAAILTTDVVQLHYAQATEVVAMINQLEKPDPNRGVTTSPPIIVADKRINAVIVSGDELSRQRIKGVVESLDRQQAKNSNVRVVYLKYGKAADVAKVLTGMLQNQGQGKSAEGAAPGSQANVQADEGTNSVLITADGDTLQTLLAVVESLDIRRAQVLVEAIIVEVTDSINKDLGVQWMYRDTKYGFGASTNKDAGFAGLAQAGLTPGDDGLKGLATGLSGLAGQTFGFGRVGVRTDFAGLLNMLQSHGGANVLSTPNLLTTDNTKAKISVGKKVPFKTGSYSTTGGGTGGTGGNSLSSPFTTINREDVGVTLEVTPHINAGNVVALDIKQEVSDVSDAGTGDGPITDQRKIDTQILTADKEIVVLGGLIKDDVHVTERRVPILGGIPLVGNLFRSKTTAKGKTNLLVFIRATIIRDDDTLADATEEKYRNVRGSQIDLRRKEKDLFNPKNSPLLPEWKEREKTKAQPAAETPATVTPAVPEGAPAVVPAAAPVETPANGGQ